jgi:KaiC/GvpD/RAD55 family RecA-like ATPase
MWPDATPGIVISMTRLATGIQGFDGMVQGGLPAGSSVVLQGPPGQEKLRFALTFLAEGLKSGASGVVVISSQSPDSTLAELRSLGVDLDAVTNEGRLRIVDWYSWSEETVKDVEERGIVVRSSVDLTNLGVALSRAIAALTKKDSPRAVIEMLSPATNIYETTQVYAFAQSAKKKFDRFGFTSLVLLEKDMHSGAGITTLHQPFDGVIEIERTRSGDRIIRKIGVLHMKDTAPDPTFRILEVTESGLRVVRETARPAAESSVPGIAGSVLESQGERARRLSLIMQIASERLKLDPKDADALFAMAAAQATLDDPRAALESLDRLAGLDPNYPGLWVLKTKLHARLGEADRARESRLQAQRAEGPETSPARSTVPCPMCDAPVAEDATVCGNCGVKFAATRKLEEELEDLGRAAIQDMVQEEMGQGAPLPVRPEPGKPKPVDREPPVPTPKPELGPPSKQTAKKGLTNGLVLSRGARRRAGMTNGLKGRTNGLRGRTNGLTNGLGRTNGLTNGLGRTNGLTNGLGRTNGLTNGLGRTNGITNGLARTHGMTNALAATRPMGFRSTGFRGMMRTAGWKLYVIPLVVVGLLLMPLFLVPEYRGPSYPIQIDGQFGDWASVATEAMASGTVLNPNIDVTRFGVMPNLGPVAFYVEVAGSVLMGGGASPGTMDTVRIFVDIDGSASTGYRIDGLGADRLIDVSGHDGAVLSSTLWEFDSNRDHRDWNGWIKGTATPAAASGSWLEVEAEWLAGVAPAVPSVATVHTLSWEGQTDTGDFPVSPGLGTLSVVADPQAPNLIAGNGVNLLRLSLVAHGQPVSLSSLRIQISGTAPANASSRLQLTDGTNVLAQVDPTSRDVTFSFAPIQVSLGGSTTLFVVGDFASSTGETFGVRLPSNLPFGIGASVVSLHENPGARLLGYLGVLPSGPRVDGAFDEWTALSSDATNDVDPRANADIDLARYGAQRGGNSTFLYTDVSGRILQGTSTPEHPRQAPQVSQGPADTDRDGVPDAVDPFPLDFNNDGTPDAQTNGDYDGDGVLDYGTPTGTDLWLNTTIPNAFPAPYSGRAVSVYIGPDNRPIVMGEDVLRIFLDLDNSSFSGYSIGGIGADRLVEIRGKDGAVTQSALMAFAGSFPGQWDWTPISPVTVALGIRAVELSVPLNATRLFVEAGDFWGSIDSTIAASAFVSRMSSFKVARATDPLSVPWAVTGPQTTAIQVDPGSNSATTIYNQQRKVVRAGDVPGQTACDATNSDGCWYVVFQDQLADLSTNIPQSPKVQNGQATLAAGTSTLNVTITSVVMTKAFVTFSASFSDANPDFSLISGQIIDATTIRFQRAKSVGAPAITIEWYVAEFNRGVTVQRNSITMTGNTVNVPISSVALAKSFPIVTYRKSGTGYGSDDFLKAKITTSTNLQLSLFNITVFDGVAEWQVIEYTDASVQTGDVTFNPGNPSDGSKTVTIPTVDETKAWLLFTYTADNGTTSNIGQKMVRGLIMTPTTLVFDRNLTFVTLTLTWYLVAFTDTTSVQSWRVYFSTGQTQKDISIECIDPTKTIVTAGGMYYRGGMTWYSSDDNPGVTTVTLDLTTSTNLRLVRGASPNDADIGWYVVEFGTGCPVAGTFPTGIQMEDGSFIQYREANIGQTGAANNPTAVGTSPACTFTSCSSGETSDNTYAVSSSDGQIASYKTVGFNIPAGSTISRVRFGVEVFQTGNFDERFDQLSLSWNAGSNYCGNTFSMIPVGSDPNDYTYMDQTTCTGHTWSASDFTGDLVAWKGVHTKNGGVNPIDLDSLIVEVAYTPPSYKLGVQYDWSGVPAGADSYTLKVKGYRQDENINVQVLTPPSTWTTRVTISATANTLYTYTLASSEYNSGAPSVRFVDANGGDATQSDFWLDLAVLTSTTLWDRIILMRSLDTSGSTWGGQIILASGRPGDSPLLSSNDSAEPSIAMDAGGFLHLVWVSAAAPGNGQTLNLVRYAKTSVAYPTQSALTSAASWTAVTSVDDTAMGYMPTVSTDTNSNPHIAWSGSKTSGTVYYKNKLAGQTDTWYARNTNSGVLTCDGFNKDLSVTAGSLKTTQSSASQNTLYCWYSPARTDTLQSGTWQAIANLWRATTGADPTVRVTIDITDSSGAVVSTILDSSRPITSTGTSNMETFTVSGVAEQSLNNHRIRLRVTKTSGGGTLNFGFDEGTGSTRIIIPRAVWSPTVSWAAAYTGISVDVSPQNNYVSLVRYFEAGTNEIQYTVCKDLSTSGCDASGEFKKADGTTGFDTVATGVETASYPSLATTYDTNGDLWVAYVKVVDGTTRSIQAKFLDYPGGAWAAAETVDSISGTIFTRPSIGVDKNNNVHALYVATSGPQLYYKERTTNWGTRVAVDAFTDNPTILLRAPNDVTYGFDSGGLYWKTSTSETYFYYIAIPEFRELMFPIAGVLSLVLVLGFRARSRSRRVLTQADSPSGVTRRYRPA